MIDRPATEETPGDRHPLGIDLDLDEREREYSPSSRLPDRDLSPYLRRYADDSAQARRRWPPTTVAYGDEPATTVDLFVPEGERPDGERPPAGHPLHVFIHGGYWQQLSKHESAFLAGPCLERGVALAAVDYTLAPEADLDRIVAECVAAVRTLRSVGVERGIDPDRIVVSGSSAGAHLAARVVQVLGPDERPAGLVLASGVYLLEPLIGTSINEAVGLDVATARRQSPLLHPLDGFPPTVVAWGENETDEFKRQSRALVDRLAGDGGAVVEAEVDGRNHFDVVFDIVPTLTDRLPA